MVNFNNVKSAVDDLSNKAAPGPDGVVTPCYKRGGVKLILFLVILFKKSLESGVVPVSMKLALISPIFNGGNRTTPASYRPVALTPHSSKLLERIIRSQLVSFLEGSGFLDSSQHGSRPGRSTLTQLLQQYDHVLDLLAQGLNVEVSYFDFAKDFDKVDLGLMIQKLHLKWSNGLWAPGSPTSY